MNKITINLKREFSTEELENMSNDVFDHIDKVVQLKIDKKESNRSYGDRIKALEESNVELAGLIQAGHKYEDIACEVTFNKPKDGIKTIVRMDDGTAWEEEMLTSEYNLENLAPLVNSTGDYMDDMMEKAAENLRNAFPDDEITITRAR